MYEDEKDFGGADILDPKKKRLGGDDESEDLEDLDNPDFIGFDEDEDLFMAVGFGEEEDAY
jgi:hypothetical protein